MATLLRQTVKVHHAIESEKLAEFGVQPLRRRMRKPQPTLEGPAAPGTSTSPPTTLEASLDPRQ